MMRRMEIWWRALADLLLPRTCLVCGKKLGLREEHLCLYCLAEMPLTHFWERSHNPMADKINGVIQEKLCSEQGTRGFDTREPYAYASALFFFHGDGRFGETDYRQILYNLKYRGNTAVGEYFGRILGHKMAGVEHFKDVDTVIPVPLHWTRKWSRGYNQAECIAKTLAAKLGVRMRTDILFRCRRTRTQTRLGVEQKGKNVQGAFKAVFQEAIPSHIVLVDDVFTTGSTLIACYSAIRKVYPSARISFATLGYVGRS